MSFSFSVWCARLLRFFVWVFFVAALFLACPLVVLAFFRFLLPFRGFSPGAVSCHSWLPGVTVVVFFFPLLFFHLSGCCASCGPVSSRVRDSHN